ncbi:uncharacterized protein LOC143448853 [Clavelina lepadiformis]|uniref:FAD-binding PCMH-type domain-containing protein n=1 Tax=Clavelina lepadiformis TaxID=159417 RepID=A0ABP0H2W1_CLALP
MTSNNAISFFVNQKEYFVSNPNPSSSFNSWLRSQPGLTGTKIMCGEGGCGCCVVALQRPVESVKAVNSCLLPLCSVDGCHITTVEGIGSQRKGFNKIQSRVAEFGASQCGYCTPGFVMSMHSLLEEEESPNQQTIEDNFDGHICRCTGYRSILDAMKCFACDADSSLKDKCQDIEDLTTTECAKKQKMRLGDLRPIQIAGDSTTWIRPSSISELKSFLQELILEKRSWRFISGNTGSGVYKLTSSYAFMIDIGQMPVLRSIDNHGDSIDFGAAVTLNEILKTLTKRSSESVTFEPIAKHLKKVASVPVRNAGSWAGNVALKCQHPEFPSDVCVLLEAARAQVKVYDIVADEYSTHTVFAADGSTLLHLTDKLIISITIPKLTGKQFKMKTYKVMPRSQNAHAYVNAAFFAELSEDQSQILQFTAVFGGISPTFARAVKTEEFLKGKSIVSETLKDALNLLSDQIKQTGTSEYKHNLALGLFYKFYLSLCNPSNLGTGIESGVYPLVRPVSKGTQTFTTDETTYPVSKEVPKLSGILQASGEAQYISDRVPSNDELFCTFVLSEVPNADIDNIDDSLAKQMPGFVAIVTGDNFPSEVQNTHLYPFDTSQPIIASSHVEFAGQPVALVIAETWEQSVLIAKAVKVTYKNIQKPILTTQDAITQASFYPDVVPPVEMGNPDEALKKAKHVVSGEFNMGSQYHFYMETQICRAECTEEGGFTLESASQTHIFIQNAISYAFGVSQNKIEITTKRIGGAYGGKATNSLIAAAAATLGSYVTRRPVRFHADLKTCMSTFGSRVPYTIKYRLGFNDNGIMEGVDCLLYGNSGASVFDAEVDGPTTVELYADSAYYCPNRRYKSYVCKTNIPSTTWCRAPGSLQMTAHADLMMEHVASFLGKDAIDVKFANLYKKGQTNLKGTVLMYCQIRDIYQNLLDKYDVRKRQQDIEVFNETNKWKKKGIAISPMKFELDLSASKYSVLMAVYANDGSVVISHGGIECGQGINTKVAQVAAYKLGISMDLISVQRASTLTGPNSQVTGGSMTSEATCKSVLGCCEVLNSRIEPIRAKMGKDVTWKNLIAKCYSEDVDLTVSHMSPTLGSRSYSSYGVTCAEVEYDVLTGEHQILKVDTVFDCGISLNPSVDIGQVEGAFVMGIGFWTSEQMIYDESSGQLVTNGTWEYKPPTSKDIPIEWNIELLKNSPNPLGILRSKATGEPPMCMSICVADALKFAVEASKRERGLKTYFPLPTPATVEALHNASELHPLEDFILQ